MPLTKPVSKIIMLSNHPLPRRILFALGLAASLATLTACDRRSGPVTEDASDISSTDKPALASEDARRDRPAGPPRPAMWKLSDADTTIYLFGGVHMLPQGLDWQTGMVDKAAREADMLILELAPEEQAKASAVLAEIAADTPQPPLEQRIPPQFTDDLDLLAARTQLSRPQLDDMESWAAALVLSNAVSRNSALSLERGTEKQLTKAFEAMGKPVTGLETVEYQLGLFDALPQRTQDALLARTISDAPNAAGKFDKLVAAWARGDVVAVGLYADSELRAVDGLAGPLLTTRNRQWAEWLRDRMQLPGTILVSVGAGHLVGDDSVQAMLAQEGYKVERVQ